MIETDLKHANSSAGAPPNFSLPLLSLKSPHDSNGSTIQLGPTPPPPIPVRQVPAHKSVDVLLACASGSAFPSGILDGSPAAELSVENSDNVISIRATQADLSQFLEKFPDSSQASRSEQLDKIYQLVMSVQNQDQEAQLIIDARGNVYIGYVNNGQANVTYMIVPPDENGEIKLVTPDEAGYRQPSNGNRGVVYSSGCGG